MKFYSPLKSVRVISFDLDDTLYDNVPIIKNAEDWFFDHIKNHPLLANFNLPSYIYLKQKLSERIPFILDDVTLCRKLVLFDMFKLASVDEDRAMGLATDIVNQFIEIRSNFCVDSSVLNILQCLKKRYYLAALTNGNVDINKIGLGSIFDLYLRANTKIHAKPSSDMFLETARFFNINICHLLHVGDDPITDILGAKNAGAQVCMIKMEKNINNTKMLPTFDIDYLEELLSLQV